MSIKYKYIGNAVHLQGSTGNAWPADEIENEDHFECGAFLYEPENNEHNEIFYVDPSRDLERIM